MSLNKYSNETREDLDPYDCKKLWCFVFYNLLSEIDIKRKTRLKSMNGICKQLTKELDEYREYILTDDFRTICDFIEIDHKRSVKLINDFIDCKI